MSSEPKFLKNLAGLDGLDVDRAPRCWIAPLVHRVPRGPSVAVGIPVALNVFEINCEGPPVWPVGRPIRVYDMEEVD